MNINFQKQLTALRNRYNIRVSNKNKRNGEYEMNKYAHLTVEELNEAIENAKRLVAEQEAEIMAAVKDMSRKKATLADIKHNNYMITKHFESKKEYEGWVAKYEEALVRAERVEEGHSEIVEFLEHIFEEDVKWQAELKADYKEKGYDAYIQMVRSGRTTKTVLAFAQMPTQEARKMFKQDLNVRYAKLVATVTKKVGKVIRIDVDRNWNNGFDGVVTGEYGTCNLTTILAGGYNIQRLHYRTLCN
jgi:hypothetical protein